MNRIGLQPNPMGGTGSSGCHKNTVTASREPYHPCWGHACWHSAPARAVQADAAQVVPSSSKAHWGRGRWGGGEIGQWRSLQWLLPLDPEPHDGLSSLIRAAQVSIGKTVGGNSRNPIAAPAAHPRRREQMSPSPKGDPSGCCRSHRMQR